MYIYIYNSEIKLEMLRTFDYVALRSIYGLFKEKSHALKRYIRPARTRDGGFHGNLTLRQHVDTVNKSRISFSLVNSRD